LNKEFARRFVMAGAAVFNWFGVIHRYLPDKARDASQHASQRGRSWENKK
jgi:hypothetical protein